MLDYVGYGQTGLNMLAKGLERVFFVVYATCVVLISALFWAHGGFIQLVLFLTGAAGVPLVLFSWLRRQVIEYPVSTFIAGGLLLFCWMGTVSKYDPVTLLLALPIVGIAWAVRGFTKKETQDGSV